MPEYAVLEMLPSFKPELYTMVELHTPSEFVIRDYDGHEIMNLDFIPDLDPWSER